MIGSQGGGYVMTNAAAVESVEAVLLVLLAVAPVDAALESS